jgi:hypothetical protein
LFEDFVFLATTNSFYRFQTGVLRARFACQRVASASSENTEKTSGFRSRL